MASSCSSSSSSSAGSPCGACKFLRRKCIRGCVFAPYFCHEQGPAHFGAIHKVFGASNVSKILTQLPISERAEAAITISYEAQARLQDPIYGCVSHIFALQQQVVNLQTQLACLKEKAAQTICTASTTSANPNLQFFPCIPQDPNLQNWPHNQTSNLQDCDDLNTLNTNVPCNNTINEISMVSEENCNISSTCHGYDQGMASNTILYSSPNIQARNSEWSSEDANDLHSIAFGYSRHS